MCEISALGEIKGCSDTTGSQTQYDCTRFKLSFILKLEYPI